jgi:hypothetical protein
MRIRQKKSFSEKSTVHINEVSTIGKNTLIRITFYCQDQEREISSLKLIKNFKF